jgi:hypothetical protein
MANTGKKMIARTQTRKPLTSRPMDLVYFMFFLVCGVRVFITPLSIHPSIHLQPYIVTTTHYHYNIPSSAIGEVVHSSVSVHGQLTPICPISKKKNSKKKKNSF